jgi:CDP-diacylglycerol--glycerol-3-phosphate 3-phosphatidyltransferase/cardiolipin synthase
MARDTIATLPNIVSLSRIPMAAAFPFLQGTEERLLLIAAAATTDLLDGYLARSRGGATRLGALIDPIADRCFVLVAVLTLYSDGTLTPLATLILMSRDVAVVGAFIVVRATPGFGAFTFMARPAGKVVTVLQFAALTSAFLLPGWLAAWIGVVAVASAVAIADYASALWQGRAAKE